MRCCFAARNTKYTIAVSGQRKWRMQRSRNIPSARHPLRISFEDCPFPVEPFRLAGSDAVLAALNQRLSRTRVPDTEPAGAPWRYGTSLASMRDVVAHWRDRYDWRKWEARINSVCHHRV